MSYLKEHYNEIFKKYSDEELIKDISSYRLGGGNLYKVLNHFFEEDIFKCCGKKTKISPWDCLQDDELMAKILDYIKSKPKFFTSNNEVSNVKSCFRNSMSWVRKVANFPAKTARDIYFRYHDVNGERLNILDTSCGFGARMSAVVLSGTQHNYYGFDPNPELYKHLKEYEHFLRKNDVIPEDLIVKIWCEGSEMFKNEIEGMIDVMFTSPPYFNLEKYSNDNFNSTKYNNSYSKWVDYFVHPTVENIYHYLKIGGYAMINIKNLSKNNPCFDDFKEAFENINGFELVEVFDMAIKKKQYGMNYDNTKGVIDNKEPVMVFRKIK